MEIVPDLRTRSELLASGVTDAEVRRLRRRGEVTTLRRGAYCSATDERLRDPDARHVLRVRATFPVLAEGSVVSHISAAAVHGLPIWNVDRDRVHVTRDAAGGGRRSPTLHVHVAPLAPDDVVTVDEMAVTSVARTVVDIARDRPFE
ncbi:MAG: type IV toxin-antitoxin system AbiEi family antitoxin domain-containing protein, partial [Pseudonocardia sediminis]